MTNLLSPDLVKLVIAKISFGFKPPWSLNRLPWPNTLTQLSYLGDPLTLLSQVIIISNTSLQPSYPGWHEVIQLRWQSSWGCFHRSLTAWH